MDRTVSWLAGAQNPEWIERTLTEIDAAIAMVAIGVGKTVRLVNLPGAEDAAFEATARAQAARVSFALNRGGPDSITLIVGPRLTGEPRLTAKRERAIEGSA